MNLDITTTRIDTAQQKQAFARGATLRSYQIKGSGREGPSLGASVKGKLLTSPNLEESTLLLTFAYWHFAYYIRTSPNLTLCFSERFQYAVSSLCFSTLDS